MTKVVLGQFRSQLNVESNKRQTKLGEKRMVQQQ